MNSLNEPIQVLHRAMGHAMYVAVPDVIYQRKDFKASREQGSDVLDTKSRRPFQSELVVFAMFPQLWSSTALGFGGIGCQAFTQAYTLVIKHQSMLYVYFDGRYAYCVNEGNDAFIKDVQKCRLASCDESIDRYALSVK